MHKRELAYETVRRNETENASHYKSSAKHSPLTKNLSFEVCDKARSEKEDNMLDTPVGELSYDDYSFFPGEKTCGNKIDDFDAERHKQEELSTKDLCSLHDRMTLAALAERISRRAKIVMNNAEGSLWGGTVEIAS